MKTIKLFVRATALSVTAFAVAAFINIKPVNNPPATKGLAVVELFTSEGCSSCPPADDLVSKIQKEYNNQPVYILVFHVDYWNRLGWKDGFSSTEYSNRQREYTKYLKTTEVYTPQIVFNGKKEFIGSEEGTLRNAIKAGLQKPSPAQITLSDIKASQNKATIRYRVEGSVNNTVLLLALIEKSAHTGVKAGENKGRNLSHVQIVRKLQSVKLNKNKSGVESIAVPKDFNTQNWEVIGVLQNTSSGEVTGATKAGFGI